MLVGSAMVVTVQVLAVVLGTVTVLAVVLVVGAVRMTTVASAVALPSLWVGRYVSAAHPTGSLDVCGLHTPGIPGQYQTVWPSKRDDSTV